MYNVHTAADVSMSMQQRDIFHFAKSKRVVLVTLHQQNHQHWQKGTSINLPFLERRPPQGQQHHYLYLLQNLDKHLQKQDQNNLLLVQELVEHLSMGTEDNLLHPLLPEGNCHKVAAHCQQSREIENSVQQQGQIQSKQEVVKDKPPGSLVLMRNLHLGLKQEKPNMVADPVSQMVI